jgi:hypothetical protein
LEIFTRGGKRRSDRIIPINIARGIETFPPDAKIRQYIPLSTGPGEGSSLLFHPVSTEQFEAGPSAFTTNGFTT